MKLRRLLALALAALLLATGCATAKVKSPYEIEVDLVNQVVTIYVAGGRDHGDIMRQMICSSGTGGEDATPTGTFYIKSRARGDRSEWYYIGKYKCYVRYPTRISGPYLFHSLPYADRDLDTIDVRARSALGLPASHGCIRLRTEDAQWIAEHCLDGTRVHIFDDAKPNRQLRSRLMERSYVLFDWPTYEDFLSDAVSDGDEEAQAAPESEPDEATPPEDAPGTPDPLENEPSTPNEPEDEPGEANPSEDAPGAPVEPEDELAAPNQAEEEPEDA